MIFDLAQMVHRMENLDDLASHFSVKQMDGVIAKMPIDKAPGPHGFNGLFMKKCWEIIKKDFYALANDFWNHSVSLENINSSFITLVPKKPSLEQIGDYRTISLTNSCLKILSKWWLIDCRNEF
jgi:hypothetical protein